MKKRTLIARLMDEARQRDLESPELELAVGGNQTMTNGGGTQPVHWEDDGGGGPIVQ